MQSVEMIRNPTYLVFFSDLKTGWENEIVEKNKTISDLRNQFNSRRNKDYTRNERNTRLLNLNLLKKSKQIPSAGKYNEVKNKVKGYFDKQVKMNKKLNEDTQN